MENGSAYRMRTCDWYISCYETIGIICPHCGTDNCKQFDKYPLKCSKCGASFYIEIRCEKEV